LPILQMFVLNQILWTFLLFLEILSAAWAAIQ
jgi:hypothetical protein